MIALELRGSGPFFFPIHRPPRGEPGGQPAVGTFFFPRPAVPSGSMLNRRADGIPATMSAIFSNVPDKVIRALEGLNLTQYEISLYLTLIVGGPLNARDLSEKSGVPYSRIYNVLSLLLDKGFVRRDDTQRPSTFAANPPDEALMLARKKVLDDFARHSKVIVDELNDLYLKNVDLPFNIPLLVYRGKDAIFKKALTLLQGASESILIAANDLVDIKEQGLLDVIKDKRARGINDIKILVEQGHDDRGIFAELEKVATIRQRDQIFGTGIAIDGVDAIIILKAQIFSMTSYFGLKSDHEAFGPIAQQYFAYLFDSAGDVGDA